MGFIREFSFAILLFCHDYDKSPYYCFALPIFWFPNISLGDHLSEDETDKLLNRRSFKPKPLIMSMDVSNDRKYLALFACCKVYFSFAWELFSACDVLFVFGWSLT